MKSRYALLSILCLSLSIGCQSPPPAARSLVPLLASTVMPRIPPTLWPAPLVSSPFPTVTAPTPTVPHSAWQFWPSADEPQAATDIVVVDDAIWVSTVSGVVRLDPQTRNYKLLELPGARGEMFSTESGRILVASDQGYQYFDGQAWRRTDFSTLREHPFASKLVGVDVNGDLWLDASLTSGNTILRFSGHVPPLDGPWLSAEEQVSTPHDPLDCSWWHIFRSATFAYHSPEDCQRLVKAQDMLRQQVQRPLAIDADGTLWWADEKTLYHLAADGSLLSQLPAPKIHRLAADPKHGVWLATEAGLFFSDGKILQPVPLGLEKHTLYGPIRGIVIDTAGTVWAATTHGFQRFNADTQRWELVHNAELDNRPFAGFAAAAEGGIWIMTYDNILYRYDGKTLFTQTEPDEGCGLGGMPSVDLRGHVWFASHGCGIVEFDPATGAWRQHRPDQNEFGGQVVHLSLGSDGSVYAVGVSGKLWMFSPAEQAWRFVVDLKDPLLVSIAADNRGGVWVRRSAEIWHYPDGTPLTLDPEVAKIGSFKIFADRQANLWVITSDKLFRYNGKSWLLVASPPLGWIDVITTAPDGRLCFATRRGIAVYDPTQDKQP